MSDIKLLCEYASTPIDVQTQRPRFSWMLKDNNVPEQLSYRITVSQDPEFTQLVWDSGTVQSKDSLGIVYNGSPLEDCTQYFWRAEISCRGGFSIEGVSHFETAISPGAQWQGQWISHPQPLDGYSILLRREICLDSLPQKARAYICGLGLYRLHINGVLASDRCLEPAWTNYNKTVLYSVLDITPYLHEGKNAIMVELGKGTYGQHHTSFKVLAGFPGPYVQSPRLLAQFNITMPNGRKLVLGTEKENWHASFGDIYENDLYDGEVCDGRINIFHYSLPEFDAEQAGWPKAAEAPAPGGVLRASRVQPIRITKTLEPVSITRISKYRCIVDFGQNFAGWVRLKMKGLPHKRVTLKHGEVLNEAGWVSTDNLRDARAIDNYVLKGEDYETYEPRFTYHGFRYVEILAEEPLEDFEIVGCAVNSDVEQTGMFKCSNKLINKIQQAVIWTERSNLHGMPDACAQRDERMAWLNDMAIRCEESMYNNNMLPIYEKWMEDIFNEQKETGSIPDTAPFIYGGNPAYHVSSIYVILPWLIYVHYGDKRIMEQYYQPVKKYVEFLATQRGEDGLIGQPYYGDWVAPLEECYTGFAYNAVPKNIPEKLITTGYLYYDCLLMNKMAELTGHQEDIPLYEKTAQEAAQAINAHLLAEDGYIPGSQAANAFPVFLDIVPEDKKQAVANSLLKEVRRRKYHITTGNQTTKYLFEALDRLEMDDAAYKIMSSDTYPSLGYMIKNGATTIWERWENEIGSSMNSHNQPMLCACTSWLYKSLGGIRLDGQPDGLNTIVISPVFPKGLKSAQASYNSFKGMITSQWKREEDEITLKVSIPWNTSALLVLPDNCKAEIKRTSSASGSTDEPSSLRPADAQDHTARKGLFPLRGEGIKLASGDYTVRFKTEQKKREK